MDMSGKTVIVAGLGVSGQSMMEVLGSRAEKVLGVDEKKPDADLHSFDRIDWDHVDLVMTSPVFNPRTPFILEAQRRGIPVMSEVELAWQLRVNCDSTGEPAQWIGITGTNGKTSTTEMTSEMLTACGLTAPAVGNIGKAVSHAAVDPANDVLCVELSSFQLHFTDSLALDCAAITNIADDHLDWHGGIDNYAADKAKVFHRVKKALVYNADDERVTRLAFAAETAEGCRKVGFTLSEPQDGQIGVKDGWIVDMSGIAGGKPGTPEQVAEVSEFTHLTEPDGTVYPHLLADALTALALVLGLGADKEKAIASLKRFTPGGHRIQTVATATTQDGGSIRFVDDSKATNVNSCWYALESMTTPVVLILGGKDKGNDYTEIESLVKEKVKAIVCMGVDNRKLHDFFDGKVEMAGDALSMSEAVEKAFAAAQPGDTVLLSPCCASFDLFKSYEDRGRQFKECVRSL